MTRFILDSGDPEEYKEAAVLLQKHGKELWGSTTNPSLIAKKIASTGTKLTKTEAFALQQSLVKEILDLVPNAVSAEVYADTDTKAQEMIEQGIEIAGWDKRVVVKLPTTIEGFKARTELRRNNSITNNTLVFSEQQIFAICLHEHLIQTTFGKKESLWPPFISPFVGRLDDIGVNGMALVKNGMLLKKRFTEDLWMLEASVRSSEHIEQGIMLDSELITAPLKTYQSWLEGNTAASATPDLPSTDQAWTPTDDLLAISTLEGFMQAIEHGTLDISHDLTDKGIIKFAEDWKAVLS